MWIVFLIATPIACIQAAYPKLLIPDFGQPVNTVNIGNEKWCLVRCVEFNSLQHQRDSCDNEGRSLEAFYKPDTFQINGGCGAIGCDQLLAQYRKPTVRCRSGNPEVVCQSEVVYRPVSPSSWTTRAPTRRARVRAEIIYHPRKSEPNGVIRRHPKISLERYSPFVDCLPGEEY